MRPLIGTPSTAGPALAAAQAAYDANADYEEIGSTTKAAAFITACRLLLRMLPKSARHGSSGAGEQVDIELTVIQAELKQAQTWYAAHVVGGAGAGSVTFLSFQDDFR